VPDKTYCTDEDILIETPDFGQLVPVDAYDAFGTDGFITVERPWTLQSSIVDFQGLKARPGTIVHLTKEQVFGDDPGEAFAVDTVEPFGLNLRRVGKPTGEGDPPGDGASEIVAIGFSIRTLYAQIVKATREIDEDLGLLDYLTADPTRVLSPPDLALLTELCVCRVLARRYIAISHGTEVPGAKEVYEQKAIYYDQRYATIKASLSLRLDTGETIAPRRRSWKRVYRPY
jgi:hypothetical protein